MIKHFLFLHFCSLVLGVNVEYRDVLIVGGNFSLNGNVTNIAHFDISTGVWSNQNEPELYVYGQSYGVIWDIAINHSFPYDKIIAVGTFDTESKMSQTMFCSVGIWNGIEYDRVILHNCHTIFEIVCRLEKVYVLEEGVFSHPFKSILLSWEIMVAFNTFKFPITHLYCRRFLCRRQFCISNMGWERVY